MPIIASEVMTDARSIFLNDSAGSVYSNIALIPLLKRAYSEMLQRLDLSDYQETREINILTNVAANAETMNLPTDFKSPLKMEELHNNKMIPMERVEWLPINLDPKDMLLFWTYREGVVYLSPATGIVSVKLYYIKNLDIIGDNSQIPIEDARDYLAARTASLAARYIGGNLDLAMSIDVDAGIAFKILESDNVKSNQGFGTRRPAFWSGYRRRGEYGDGF